MVALSGAPVQGLHVSPHPHPCLSRWGQGAGAGQGHRLLAVRTPYCLCVQSLVPPLDQPDSSSAAGATGRGAWGLRPLAAVQSSSRIMDIAWNRVLPHEVRRLTALPARHVSLLQPRQFFGGSLAECGLETVKGRALCRQALQAHHSSRRAAWRATSGKTKKDCAGAFEGLADKGGGRCRHPPLVGPTQCKAAAFLQAASPPGMSAPPF